MPKHEFRYDRDGLKADISLSVPEGFWGRVLRVQGAMALVALVVLILMRVMGS